MQPGNKKTFESVKNETIIPIGFYEHKNSHSLFCRIKEFPKEIYLIPGKRNDFCRFSQFKEKVVFKSRFLDEKIKLENIDNIISSVVNNKKVVTFIYKKNQSKNLYWAISKKENEWLVQGPIGKIKEIGGAVSDHKHGKDYVLYYGERSIHAVFSPNFLKWNNIKEPVLKPRPGFFDKDGLKFIASKITDKGVLVFYDSSVKQNDNLKIQIGVAMFSLTDPCKLIWRADEPIFEDCATYEKDLECKGMIFSNSKLAIYWHSKNYGLLISSFAVPFHSNLTKEKIKTLSRHHSNPIISPKVINGKEWMAQGAFNPAAVVIKDKTHLLFRAVGNDGISRVGHSASYDGVHFDKIYPKPVFYLKRSHFGSGPLKDRYDPVMYPSGGSWGGCEDPRLVNIDGKIYMTFNAFDGWDFIRVGYTSIKEEDFAKEKWNWSKPKLISPCGEINKNWVIFPEKINGKFAILHSLTPEVQIDYVDNLDDLASGKQKIKSRYGRKAPRRTWDTWVRGAGPTPIKTPDGWLVFYHAIGANEPSKYKLGVMLLDLHNPTKILARSSSPILLPDMWYENEGKPGIVYACGAVVRDNMLYIYYGGGDKFVCVATANFNEFINSIKNISERVPFISKVIFS
jgi:beta-1,2-mannobiose phosphorylase / 1,2-beta-oligomannan phosphorylase